MTKFINKLRQYWWLLLLAMLGLVAAIFRAGSDKTKPKIITSAKEGLQVKALEAEVEILKGEARAVAKTAHKRAELELIERQDDPKVRRELLADFLESNL